MNGKTKVSLISRRFYEDMQKNHKYGYAIQLDFDFDGVLCGSQYHPSSDTKYEHICRNLLLVGS